MKATTTLKRKWKPGLLILAGMTVAAVGTVPVNRASAHFYGDFPENHRHGNYYDGYYYRHGTYYHTHDRGYWSERPDGVRVWTEY